MLFNNTTSNTAISLNRIKRLCELILGLNNITHKIYNGLQFINENAIIVHNTSQPLSFPSPQMFIHNNLGR
jgi:hypothetical protein